jgi:hypothetical protein
MLAALTDNIYALLGISLPLAVSVDYDKSIFNVFVEATRAIIVNSKTLMYCVWC